jgi:hypothetical protein
MSRLDVDGTVSKAVDSLMDAKEDTIGEIRKAHGRYVAAGEALVGYASSLERVQSETLAALDRAREAQDAAQAASGSKDRWQDLADSAKDETENKSVASTGTQREPSTHGASTMKRARTTTRKPPTQRTSRGRATFRYLGSETNHGRRRASNARDAVRRSG